MPYAKPYRSILIHRGEVEKRGYHIKRDKLMLMYRAAVGRWEEESLLCPIQLFNSTISTSRNSCHNSWKQRKNNTIPCEWKVLSSAPSQIDSYFHYDIKNIWKSQHTFDNCFIVFYLQQLVFCIRYPLRGTNQYFYCFSFMMISIFPVC